MLETLGGSYDPALPPVQVRDREDAPAPWPLAIVLPFILFIVLNRLYGRRRRRRRGGPGGIIVIPSDWSGRHSRAGGGSSGGGGFSGGGGSFGGGGASGRW
jgi:uncharacterized protein